MSEKKIFFGDPFELAEHIAQQRVELGEPNLAKTQQDVVAENSVTHAPSDEEVAQEVPSGYSAVRSAWTGSLVVRSTGKKEPSHSGTSLSQAN